MKWIRVFAASVVVLGAVCGHAAENGIAGEPAVGTRPPAVKVAKVIEGDGGKVDLAAMRGDVVVLEFWATWCGPCVKAIPHLNELAGRYKGKPVRFVMLTAEEEGAVRRFMEKRPVGGTVTLDDGGATFAAYGIRRIPTTVLIDRNGLVAAVTEPELVTPRMIDALLAGEAVEARRAAPGLAKNDVPGLLPGSDPDAPLPHFQVVLRKASHRFEGYRSDGRGRWTAASMSPAKLFADAYGVQPARVVVEEGAALPDEPYDLAVFAPGATRDAISPTLRQALQTGFGRTASMERRELAALVMAVPDRSELKLKEAKTGGGSILNSPGRMGGEGVTVGFLRSLLEAKVGRVVVDETGLDGRYDVELTWDAEATDQREAIARALREQLGVEVTEGRREVEVLVVRRGK